MVGPSGSGKTTLLRLLNRLDDPDAGTVLFEGSDIRSYDVLHLRRRVQLVGQVPVPFAGTVSDSAPSLSWWPWASCSTSCSATAAP